MSVDKKMYVITGALLWNMYMSAVANADNKSAGVAESSETHAHADNKAAKRFLTDDNAGVSSITAGLSCPLDPRAPPQETVGKTHTAMGPGGAEPEPGSAADLLHMNLATSFCAVDNCLDRFADSVERDV